MPSHYSSDYSGRSSHSSEKLEYENLFDSINDCNLAGLKADIKELPNNEVTKKLINDLLKFARAKYKLVRDIDCNKIIKYLIQLKELKKKIHATTSATAAAAAGGRRTRRTNRKSHKYTKRRK